jgi:hypothetical protein
MAVPVAAKVVYRVPSLRRSSYSRQQLIRGMWSVSEGDDGSRGLRGGELRRE